MGTALALAGHGYLAILPCQLRLLDTRHPARSGHLGAHHAPLMGGAAQDLPGRGRIGVRVREGNVPVREQKCLERRGIARGIRHAASGEPVVI